MYSRVAGCGMLPSESGLPASSWKQGAQFLVFQAIVFDESQFK